MPDPEDLPAHAINPRALLATFAIGALLGGGVALLLRARDEADVESLLRDFRLPARHRRRPPAPPTAIPTAETEASHTFLETLFQGLTERVMPLLGAVVRQASQSPRPTQDAPEE